MFGEGGAQKNLHHNETTVIWTGISKNEITFFFFF